MKKKKIAVVGAGIAGLTCAYELQKAGFEVVVYEKESWVGGRMASREKDGYMFDIGAEHLILMYSEIRKYCEEFDVPWENTKFPSYSILHNGEIKQLLPSLSFLSKLKLSISHFMVGKLDFLNLTNNAHLDNEDAYTYAKRKFTQQLADYVVDPISTSYQFHRSNEISKAVLLGMLSSVGREKEMWREARTKKGMSALPDAFAKRLTIRLESEVHSVSSSKEGVVVDGELYDIAVLASTANATKRIYKNPTEPQAALLDSVRYATTISVCFRIPQGMLNKFGVAWFPYKESKTIASFINGEIKGVETTRDGMTLASIWLHEEYAKELMNKSDEEIFQAVKKEFISLYPVAKDQMINHDLQRWPQAMPKFEKGFIIKVKNFLENGQGDQNVYFCGDYLNSLWTEGALRCGQRVAKVVKEKLSS